jgi:hypothetical protein
LRYRLQWGKPDRLSLFRSALHEDHDSQSTVPNGVAGRVSPPLHFTANTPRQYLSIIQNDWPYSGICRVPSSCCLHQRLMVVPEDVEHTLIWARLPIFHPAIIPEEIAARVEQDGLWGFTGSSSPPPSPSTLPSCLPALAEWGITMASLVRSPQGTESEEVAIKRASHEIHQFVRSRWAESEWETAWFVNPPVGICLSILLLRNPAHEHWYTEAAKYSWFGTYSRIRTAQDRSRERSLYFQLNLTCSPRHEPISQEFRMFQSHDASVTLHVLET